VTGLDLGEGVLRLFGALYVVGAVFLLNQLRMNVFIDRALDTLDRMTAELAADAGEPPKPSTPNDAGRTWWMVAGGVLLLVAGVTMLLGLRVSVIALGVLVLHQLAYFVRQRRLELAAATPEDALDARPTQATRNGFFFCLILFVIAAWLERSGVLS
jgi:Flp pilus assembly protein TadB